MASLRARLSGINALPREARLLLAMTSIFGLGYGGIGMMLRPLYVLRLDLGPAYYGLYSASGSLAFMVASFGAGWLGARFSTRRTMIYGAGACLVGTAVMPLTEAFDASLWPIMPIVSNLVLSAAWSLVGVNTVPALTGVTAEEQRDRAIGLSNTLSGLGFLLGNLLGGVLPRLLTGLLQASPNSNDGFRASLSLVLLFGLGALALLLALPEQPAAPRLSRAHDEPLPWTPMLVVGLFAVLIPASAAADGTYTLPYLNQDLHWSTEAIGALASVGQALAVLGMSATPWLARRFTSRGATVLVGTGMALALLPMAAIPHWAAAVFSRTVSGAFNMMRIPVMQMLAMAQVPQTRRPLMSGLLFGAGGVCFTAVSYLGGLLAAAHGYRAVFWAAAGVTGVSVALFGAVTRALVARGQLQRG